MSIIVFSIAAILSLPKQFVTVYLGVLLEGADSACTLRSRNPDFDPFFCFTAETTGQRIASYAIVAISVIITVLAMWYIYRQMNKHKVAYIYERRKARFVIVTLCVRFLAINETGTGKPSSLRPG